MAGSDSKYKDSYISQEDLDSLLEGAGNTGPDAFADHSPPNPPSRDDDVEEVISQDDIDALLSLADGESPNQESPDDVISQDDIDALLEGKHDAAPSADDVPEDDTADLDLVTPEDIEKLLRAESMGNAPVPEAVPDTASSDFDSISQEDLNDLSASMEIKADAGPQTDDDDDSLISQEDINALLAGNMDEEAPEQDVITPVPVAEESTGEEDSLISQDDIASLLADAGDDGEYEAKDEANDDDDDSNLISQEDIDKLLIGKSEEVESEETLIDQEDIDRLLSAATPMDEGGFSGQSETDKLISQEDIDKLLNEDISESFQGEDSVIDQVILEQSTDIEKNEVEAAEKPAWHRSKLFVSAAAVALVLMISLTAIMMFSGKSEPPPDVAVTPETTTPSGPEQVPGETYPMEEYSPQTYETITVAMNGFVVPSPVAIKGLSYIALDLTFEITDAPANPIKDYEPFFRNIVYEVLNKAFILQSEGKIVEADLKKMIRDALNDALSEGSIARVDFIHFKVS